MSEEKLDMILRDIGDLRVTCAVTAERVTALPELEDRVSALEALRWRIMGALTLGTLLSGGLWALAGR